MRRFGIDISKWQGDFDLITAIKEGVEFVILKSGGADDGLYKDPLFEKNYALAKSIGLPVGVYWFSKATSPEEAEKEADWFYDNIISGKQFELPIFIDVEHSDMLSAGKKLLTITVDTWCKNLEKRNLWVGIYSTPFAFSNYMDDSVLSRYTHWIAQWSEKNTYPFPEIMGFWQFGGDTNMIRSNIIAGKVCDQNYMYRDFPSLIKQKGLNGFDSNYYNPSPTPPYKKSINDIAKEVILGKWGNGEDRKMRITSAGYDYASIQNAVNSILKKTPSSEKQEAISVGDIVKLSENGTVYGSKKKFASFVYNNVLYVRAIDGDRAVISLYPEGPVTGAVNVEHLKKHKT